MYISFTYIDHMDEYIHVLDNRMEKKQVKVVSLVAKKSRCLGSPSESLPPPYTPAWAIKANKDGISITIYINCDPKDDFYLFFCWGTASE